MTAADSHRGYGRRSVTGLLLLAAVVLSACTSPGPRPAMARIAIEPDVGFTITENARIGSNLRTQYEEGLALIEAGRHDRGVELLESVAEAAPELSAPRVDLGIASRSAGDLEAAERHLLLALEANPDHPIAHNEMGIVYRMTGRFEAARQSYLAALDIFPQYHYAQRNLAIVCDLYLADLDCALENYQAYLATVGSDEQVSMWLADLRMRMDRMENLDE